MSGDLSGWQLEFHAIFPGFDLHDSFGEALVSDDDLERGSHQVRIVELHARPFVPIIPKYLEPCCLEVVVELRGDLGSLC